jgi:2-keto-3-deoxy-6-phosphogluconate aldolase
LYWSFPATVIPVLRSGNAEEMCRAADCLLEAGFSSLELTLRTPGEAGLLK